MRYGGMMHVHAHVAATRVRCVRVGFMSSALRWMTPSRERKKVERRGLLKRKKEDENYQDRTWWNRLELLPWCGEAELPLCEQFRGSGYISADCNAATYIHRCGAIHIYTQITAEVCFQVMRDLRANDGCWWEKCQTETYQLVLHLFWYTRGSRARQTEQRRDREDEKEIRGGEGELKNRRENEKVCGIIEWDGRRVQELRGGRGEWQKQITAAETWREMEDGDGKWTRELS